MKSKDRTRQIFTIILGLALVLVIIFGIVPRIIEGPTTSTEPPLGEVAEATIETPPEGAIELVMLTADTKAEWIETVTESFNAAGIETATGKPIFVRFAEEGSPADAQQAVLDGQIQPTIWSPGDMSWVEAANQISRDRGNRPLVTQPCRPVVYAATGFAMWRPMAEVLGWPDKPIGWDEIVELAADPEGWGSYGHPEWGRFTFGHTHPEHSNTGFAMLATLAYAALDMTSGLTPELVKSDEVVEAFRTVELNTYHYGTSTKDLMNLMAYQGPAYLHALTGSETAVLANNKYVPAPDDKRFPYVFIFPAEGTFWSDNPFCILETDWVSDEQREAALVYRDYLLAPEQQEIAIEIGLRPADPNVALHAPIALENGTDPRVSPATVPPLEGVSGETAAAIIDVFKQTKKKATVLVVLDISGSMAGKKLTNAIDGTINFINRLARDDEVIVVVFDESSTELQPSGRVGDVVETLSKTINGLFTGGGTALYDAICQAVDSTNQLQEADETSGEKRLYGIVLLSDGQDTDSEFTENDMLNCLPSGEKVEGVKVFTIAYGDDADEDLLLRIANRTNGTAHIADPNNPSTIEEIYLAISAEQ